MAGEVSQRDALVQLGHATTEAIAGVLEMFLPGGVQHGDVVVIDSHQDAFAGLPDGGIAASVRYVEGAIGANVFIMPAAGARALATAMGAGEAEDGPLTELELSAVGEAANQMLASAAAAIGVVIGHEIEISPPDVRQIDAKLDPVDAFGTAPHACSTSLTIAGELCRLVQLVPNAVIVRMARAMDDMSVTEAVSNDSSRSAGEHSLGPDVPLSEQLGGVGIRVWAELGRTQLPIGTALALPPGAVVDLDRTVDAPVDLFVNGLCFGHGKLLVTEDGEWAVEVTVLDTPFVRQPALVGGAGIVAEREPEQVPANT